MLVLYPLTHSNTFLLMHLINPNHNITSYTNSQSLIIIGQMGPETVHIQYYSFQGIETTQQAEKGVL